MPFFLVVVIFIEKQGFVYLVDRKVSALIYHPSQRISLSIEKVISNR